MRLQSKPRRIAARTTASLILAAAILLTGCGGGGGGAPCPLKLDQPAQQFPRLKLCKLVQLFFVEFFQLLQFLRQLGTGAD